jgi:hypothetical protein
MARFCLVVYSKPVEHREQEYNDWYSNQHLKDLLAMPGVLSARRFKLSGTQMPNKPLPGQQYLAIYDIEAEDVNSFINEMTLRGADGRMPISTALSTDLVAEFWNAI